MNNLYVISGVTGMTGSELARQLLKAGHSVIGLIIFLPVLWIRYKTLWNLLIFISLNMI